MRKGTSAIGCIVGGVTVMALLATGCSSSAKTALAPATSTATVTTTNPPAGQPGHVAIPVSKNPSTSAKMICETDVEREVFDLVGVKPSQPLQPLWKDHVYSCKYVYPNGTLTLSVKELANKAETDAYFASLATQLHKKKVVQYLGQGAFTTQNESAVVRKDYKVLTVDVSGLPAQFGTPADQRGNIALNVAASIMSCWTGA